MVGGGGSKGRGAMMLGRERASVQEVRVGGGRVDEGNERGRDGSRHGPSSRQYSPTFSSLSLHGQYQCAHCSANTDRATVGQILLG